LRTRQKVETEKIAIVGCVHTPQHDEDAVEACLSYLKYWKPDKLILNGDIYDLHILSRHRKDWMTVPTLKEERDAARWFNSQARKAVGKDCEILSLLGNHDARWDIALNDDSPHLRPFSEFSFESFFGLDESGIHLVKSRGLGGYARIKLGEVLVGHFEIARKDSGATAKALVLNNFGSVVAHHSHRMGQYERFTPNGRLLGQEGGCLCSMEPGYVEFPDWAQGFVTMERVSDKDRYHINPVRVVNGKILDNGYLY
jgi:hypothetical protein